MPTRQCTRSMIAGVLLLASALGCRLLESGPNDEQVIAAVRKSLPSPPTLGPTYLAEVVSVQVEERGRYNPDGRYWPVRVRIKGAAQAQGDERLPAGALRRPPEAAGDAGGLRGGGAPYQGRFRGLACVLFLRPQRPEVAARGPPCCAALPAIDLWPRPTAQRTGAAHADLEGSHPPAGVFDARNHRHTTGRQAH